MEKRQLANYAMIICLLAHGALVGQTGGRQSFQFLNVAPGCRVSALGGMPLGIFAKDPGSAFLNPALLSADMKGLLHFSSLSYIADIQLGHVSYSHSLDSGALNLQAGVHYAKYGDIPRTDEYGNTFGNFKANETDFYIAASRKLNERISLGVSLNFLFSNLDQYTSQAIGINSGINYHNPEKRFGLSLVFRNAGFQLSKYTQTKESLPFQAQLSFAKKLKHLPLTYHIGIQHLQNWNVRYDDPNLNDDGLLFGETSEDSKFDQELSNFFRHFVFGVELNIGQKENFSLRLGYNHLRNRELSLADYRSFAGLSVGFGLKIYKFKFEYSYASYHLAGGSNQISISTNLSSFFQI